MRVKTVSWEPGTCGITRASLKKLRDAIVDHFRDYLAVIQVMTSDITCGYFIVTSTGFWTWSGDGFRTDKGGEGGAGQWAAEELFKLFGIRYFTWEGTWDDRAAIPPGTCLENWNDFYAKALFSLAENIGRDLPLGDSEFTMPQAYHPQY